MSKNPPNWWAGGALNSQKALGWPSHSTLAYPPQEGMGGPLFVFLPLPGGRGSNCYAGFRDEVKVGQYEGKRGRRRGGEIQPMQRIIR